MACRIWVGLRGQPRIAEIDLDNAVAPNPRADGDRQLTERELEVRNLQSFRSERISRWAASPAPARPPAAWPHVRER